MVTWAASKTFLLGVSGFRPEEELTPGAYATGSLKDFIIPSKHSTGAYAIRFRHSLTPLALPRAHAIWPGPGGWGF